MSNAIVAALVAQWALLIGLCVVVLALLRQVGMLHERLGPVGALVMPGGPAVGDMAPTFTLDAVDGRKVNLGGEHASSLGLTLLFFISPTCPVCKSLLPLIKSVHREQAGKLDVVLASDGDFPAQLAMVRRERLEAYPLVLSTPLGLAYQVSKLPHAVLIDGAGKIVAKGLVNNREHLESLFEAHRLGVGSLQDLAAGTAILDGENKQEHERHAQI